MLHFLPPVIFMYIHAFYTYICIRGYAKLYLTLFVYKTCKYIDQKNIFLK